MLDQTHTPAAALAGLSVSIRDLTLSFGSVTVLKDLNLDIGNGEFLVLLGASGCGKSTLLNCIAGLIEPTGGQIFISGQNVTWAEPSARGIGMVFQSYALYPQMTVEGNLSFGLRNAGVARDEIARRVARAAEILQLQPLLKRKPAALSGGQRQRVAIGRALVRDVDVFLFDEPLSNLDAKLRAELRVEIKRLHQNLKNTMIYVTHDQIEAMTLADRIVIMRDGHIVQIGTPLEVFERPVNAFVATFIGSPPMNLLPGRVEGGSVKLSDGTTIPLPPGTTAAEGRTVHFGVRADNIMPDGHAMPPTAHMAYVDMPVTLTEPLGTETLLFATLAGTEVQAKMLNPRPVQTGERLRFGIALDKCHLFDAETGASLRV